MRKVLLTVLSLIFFSGCATSTRYFNYTDETFPPKPKYYFISVYSDKQKPKTEVPYIVIGKVQVIGRATDGANRDFFVERAKNIARQKGADAILNAHTDRVPYEETFVTPGRSVYRPVYVYGRHHANEVVYVEHYRYPQYYTYHDTVLTFSGDLAVFHNSEP